LADGQLMIFDVTNDMDMILIFQAHDGEISSIDIGVASEGLKNKVLNKLRKLGGLSLIILFLRRFGGIGWL